DTLHLLPGQIGLSGSAYLVGAVLGALFFGWLTDQLGRKKLFLVTLAVYLAATTATAFSWGFTSFAVFRFFTGFGIGGEYAAINSAIDELLPARVRGWADLAINGSFWVGCALGAGASLVLLDPRVLGHALGWRIAFGLGTTMSFAILIVRRHVPESPRWLLLHGRDAEAEAIMSLIERDVANATGSTLASVTETAHVSRVRIGIFEAVRILFTSYRRRALFGLALMVAQAFFYNAIFFTYALVLTTFYAVPNDRVGIYIFPFALGNFVGPLVLGRLFDTIGRRRMIALTYVVSALLLTVTGWAFARGLLDATTQTVAWSVVFFFASAAASSAYLTVSEIFPLAMRAQAIALFYAVGTGIGGAVAPALFAALVATKSRDSVFTGYLIASTMMTLAALVALRWGVDAERKPLEQVASHGA
ncbi:MAG: transporter, partial [Myxococcaceae bacterium]|nr:transporter [Myxococcaceae bacterium]